MKYYSLDNTDVKKLQGSGAVFNELTLEILLGIFQLPYQGNFAWLKCNA